MKYDLEQRTEKFAKSLIRFCKAIRLNTVTKPLVDQLIRSGTSIGANYHEANGASSKKDFRNKIFICKKESKETVYWLNLIVEAEPNCKAMSDEIRDEAQQLIFIFSKIARSSH